MNEQPKMLYEPMPEDEQQMKVMIEMLSYMMKIDAQKLNAKLLSTLRNLFDQGKSSEAMKHLMANQIFPSST